MPAHINSIFVCPRCSESITTPDTAVSCPICGIPLGGKSGIRGFTPPFTLTEQLLKLENRERHLEALLSLTPEKVNSMMNDALNIMETVAAKKVRISDIRNLIAMAIRIGDIGKTYDAFIQAGGQHVPGLKLELDEASSVLTENQLPSPTKPHDPKEIQNELQKTGDRVSAATGTADDAETYFR